MIYTEQDDLENLTQESENEIFDVNCLDAPPERSFEEQEEDRMLNTAQQRKHAELLRTRDDSPAAQAVAAEIAAAAELYDALANRPAVVAESARMVEQYPILGKVTRAGGKIIEIERPWTDADNTRIEAQGVAIAFEWCHDPMAGLRQGELIRIYIGTRDQGPRLQWDHTRRQWFRLVSRGNYGKNWSHGGNWREEKPGFDTLAEVYPALPPILGRD